MTFRIGQKCVCIHSGRWFDAYGRDPEGIKPAFNGVYTIRGIRDFFPFGCGLVFEEILNPPSGSPTFEVHFRSDHFRPLIESKTDISALIALLNPLNHTTPLPEDEDALERELLEIFEEAMR